MAIFLFPTNHLFAQNEAQRQVALHFEPVFNGQSFVLDSPKSFELKGEKVELEVLRFYISGIAFTKNAQPVWQETDSYHLIDAGLPNTLTLQLNLENEIEFDGVRFNLGIDSLTNVSGAFGGDLDPTKGMYWAWQSGYVNFKLEGASPVCPARNNEFQFHLGGYAAPFANMQTINLLTEELDMNDKKGMKGMKENQTITIQFDVASYLSNYDLSHQYKVMSPSLEGTHMARVAARLFQIKW